MNPRAPIITRRDDFCPLPDFQWQATFGEWEFGDPQGLGSTEGEAIADLVAQMEDEYDA